MRKKYLQLEIDSAEFEVASDEWQQTMSERLANVEKRYLIFLGKRHEAALVQAEIKPDDIARIKQGQLPATPEGKEADPWVVHQRVPIFLGGRAEIENLCLMRKSNSDALLEYLDFQSQEFVSGQRVKLDLAQPYKEVNVYKTEIGEELARPFLELEKSAMLARMLWLEEFEKIKLRHAEQATKTKVAQVPRHIIEKTNPPRMRPKERPSLPPNFEITGETRILPKGAPVLPLNFEITGETRILPKGTPVLPLNLYQRPEAQPPAPDFKEQLENLEYSEKRDYFKLDSHVVIDDGKFKRTVKGWGSSSKRSRFMALVATVAADKLLSSGFEQHDIDLMKRGKNCDKIQNNGLDANHPRAWRVHHILPLSFGGDNSIDNFCLIRVEAERELHKFMDEQLDGVGSSGRSVEILVPNPGPFCDMTAAEARAMLPDKWVKVYSPKQVKIVLPEDCQIKDGAEVRPSLLLRGMPQQADFSTSSVVHRRWAKV